jgi:hypothetical protein
MSIGKKIKSIVERIHNRFSSRKNYYIDENGGRVQPRGEELMQIHNRELQDMGSSFFH